MELGTLLKYLEYVKNLYDGYLEDGTIDLGEMDNMVDEFEKFKNRVATSATIPLEVKEKVAAIPFTYTKAIVKRQSNISGFLRFLGYRYSTAQDVLEEDREAVIRNLRSAVNQLLFDLKVKYT